MLTHQTRVYHEKEKEDKGDVEQLHYTAQQVALSQFKVALQKFGTFLNLPRCSFDYKVS